MPIKWPPEVRWFIEENAPGRSARELAELTNAAMGTDFTPQTMKNYKSNHGIKSGTRRGNPKGWTRKYPAGMDEYIKAIAPGRSSQEITEMVNAKFGAETITIAKLRAYKKNHGITSGYDCRFKSGHVPKNKGKWQAEFMSQEAIERSKATRFKRGDVPKNQLPVGSVVKSKDGYLLIKKQMSGSQRERWQFLHRTIWEEHHGPIPEGYAVEFKDGNKENVDIENLFLASRAEHAVMNHFNLRFTDPDLTETGHVIAKLKIKMERTRKKRRKDEERD